MRISSHVNGAFSHRVHQNPVCAASRIFQPRRAALIISAFAMLAELTGCSEPTPAATGLIHVVAQSGHGFQSRVFTDAQGNSHKYVLFVPYGYVHGSKPPVLMFLNGLGENGDDGIRQISNNFGIQAWESREFFPFLTIAPQCRKEGAWQPGQADVAWALEILDKVIEEFGADADRVSLTGVSSGGGGVWNVGTAFPDRFAALAPLAGSGGDPQLLAETRMPVWAFCNDGDEKGLVDWNRDARKQLIEGGCSPIVSEYAATGHDCWNRAYRTAALLGWLQEQRRSESKQAAPYQYLPPDQIIKNWRRTGGGVWTAKSDGGDDVLQGGGGKAEGLLVSASAAAAMEFHGDLWLPADVPDCRFALVSKSQPDRAAFLVCIAPSNRGTGCVLNAAGEQLAEFDPAAQRTLRVGAWNDVRIEISEVSLKVRLNGWPAVDLKLSGAKTEGEYRSALVAPRENAEVRWRFIRTRKGKRAANSPKRNSN